MLWSREKLSTQMKSLAPLSTGESYVKFAEHPQEKELSIQQNSRTRTLRRRRTFRRQVHKKISVLHHIHILSLQLYCREHDAQQVEMLQILQNTS